MDLDINREVPAMRSGWALLFVLMHITGFSGAATAQTQRQCAAPDPDLTITSCTAMIQSGRETPQNLAGAFYSRGRAYVSKGQYDRAIQDLDQAIRLYPNVAQLFSTRGAAYTDKGQYDRSYRRKLVTARIGRAAYRGGA
jgi:lipoprotein NlpI